MSIPSSFLTQTDFASIPENLRAVYFASIPVQKFSSLIQEHEKDFTHEKCSHVWRDFLNIIDVQAPNCRDEQIPNFVSGYINNLLARYDKYVKDSTKVPVEISPLPKLFKERLKKKQNTIKDIEYLMKAIDECVFLEQIGCLQLPVYAHTSIPELEKFEKLSNSKIVDEINKWIDENVDALLEFKKLEISEKSISHIPAFISKLANLEELIIDKTDIEFVPDSILKLKKLKTLIIFNNKSLKVLPEKIGNLKSLLNLCLDHNLLTFLPDSICDLTNLIRLVISHNKYLTVLPEKIGNLKSLLNLCLDHNLLTFLPDSICDLNELDTLNISSNNLESLPERFGNLENLETLIMYKNKIKEIPSSVKGLTSLKKLMCDKGFKKDDFPSLKLYRPGIE